MTETFRPTPRRLTIREPRWSAQLKWRWFEWWGVGISLLLLADAPFPLLMMDASGGLTESQKATLRLLAVPAYLIAVVLLWRNRAQALQALRSNLPMAVLLVLPLLSTLWSISPSITLRRAVALLLTMLLGYALAIRFTPRQLLFLASAVLGSCMAMSLIMVAVAPDLAFMPGESALRGAFTHKNVLGQMAGFAAVLAVAMMWDGDTRLLWGGRILLLPALACLALSESVTAMLSVVFALGVMIFYAVLARCSRLGRIVLIMIVLQLVAALLVWLDFYLVPFLNAFGKDATLTGRVPLWAELDPEIVARLWSGYGYEAFWTPGNGEVWRIWSVIGWPAPNAHNGWRDALLSFGLPGTILLAVAIARAFVHGAILHSAEPKEGWLWLSGMLGMILSINLTESSLMLQNDLMWCIVSAAIVMFSLYRPAVGSNRPRTG